MIRDKLTEVWGYFFQVWREHVRRETLNLFGVGLASGLPMNTAIKLAAKGSSWPPLRRAFASLLQGQAQGYQLRDILLQSASSEIPPLYRAIMGANLEDREKGLILQVKNYPPTTVWLTRGDSLHYLATEFAVTWLVLVALISFVLPQFEEIYLGMRIPMPFVTQVLIAISTAARGWGSIMAVIAILLIRNRENIYSFLGIGARTAELIDVLRIMHNLKPERIPEVLEIIGHPMILPQTGQGFALLAERLIRGEPLDCALEKLRMDPLAAWILSQAVRRPGEFEGKRDSSNLFLEAAEMLETGLNGSRKRQRILLENCVVIGLGGCVAVICAGVMMPMIRLLESM